MHKKVEALVSLTLIALMPIFSMSVAESEEIGAKQGGGRGYFMCGGSIVDIDALNSRLEGKGYSEFSHNFFSIGGGGHAIINRVIIGGEGHALIGRGETSGNYENSLSAGYGFFDVGYIVYSTRYLNVYPLLGLGGGGVDLKIMERGAPSFDEVLDDPKRSANLSTGGFLLNVALGTDYLLKLGGDEEGEGGLVFGLRVGYTFTPIKGEWEMNGTEISGGPEVGITGPYVHLMIGGGGVSKE